MLSLDIALPSDEAASNSKALNEPSVKKHHHAWRIAPDFPYDPHQPPERRHTGPTKKFNDISLIDHVRSHADREGDRIAIDDGQATISYKDLLQRAISLSSIIRSQTKDGEAVGVALKNSIALHIAILGCIAAQRPYIAMDMHSPNERNRTILKKSELRTIISNKIAQLDGLHLTDSHSVINVEDTMHTQLETEALRYRKITNTEKPAIILYTSGSTGEPKGIVNSEKAVLERVRQYIHSVGFTRDDVFLPLSSACTIAGTRECFTALAVGAKLVLASPDENGLHGIRSLIKQKGVTILNGVPAVLRALMMGANENRQDFQSVRMIRVGGDRILPQDIELFFATCSDQCRIQAGYSSTETTATYYEVPREPEKRTATIAAGYLHSEVAYCIEAIDTEKDAPIDEGELIIKSTYVALGYWREGRIERGTIETDSHDPNVRLFHTGDLVRQRENGLLEIIGRKDRQVKINGKRVEPAELELSLRSLEGISDAAIITVMEADQQRLVAFIVAKSTVPSQDQGIDQIRHRLRDVLPSSLNPTRLHLIDRIPRLPSGKQDNTELLALDNALSTKEEVHPNQEASVNADPHSLLSVIAKEWRNILGKAAYRSDRTWDECGGDSLSLIKLVFLLENALGQSLKMSDFRLDMTPNDIAQLILQDIPEKPTPLDIVGKPNVFLLPGLTGEGPSLAAFRQELSSHMNVHLVDFPSCQQMIDGRDNISDMVNASIDTIAHVQPNGQIYLLGYSLGGSVAYLTAKALYEQGRTIGLLAILDNNVHRRHEFNIAPKNFKVSFYQNDDVQRLTIFEKLIETSAIVLSHPKFRALLSYLSAFEYSWLPHTLRFTTRNSIWEALQSRAFDLWVKQSEASALPIEAKIIVSEHVRPNVPNDLGWKNYIRDISLYPVKGTHHSMIRQPNREQLVKLVAELVEQSVLTSPMG